MAIGLHFHRIPLIWATPLCNWLFFHRHRLCFKYMKIEIKIKNTNNFSIRNNLLLQKLHFICYSYYFSHVVFFCCHPDVITHHHGDELTRRFMMTMLTGLQILQGINCVLYDIWRHFHLAIGDVMSQKKEFFFYCSLFFLVRSTNA